MENELLELERKLQEKKKEQIEVLSKQEKLIINESFASHLIRGTEFNSRDWNLEAWEGWFWYKYNRKMTDKEWEKFRRRDSYGQLKFGLIPNLIVKAHNFDKFVPKEKPKEELFDDPN